MAVERWGSLSVEGHIDTANLITNVLLYDRLVLPVFTEQPDRDELQVWEEQGWRPELQAERLDQLGELAIRKPWDARLRAQFDARVEDARANPEDKIDYFGFTQEIIGSKAELLHLKFPGVTAATTIAAYNSESGFQKDFQVGDQQANLASQAFLLGRRLIIPKIDDPEDALRRAIELSQTDSFRQKRGRLFNWQEGFAHNKRLSPDEVVREVELLTNDYNKAVQNAYDDVAKKSVFTLFSVGLTIAGIGTNLIIPGAGILLALVGFAAMDAKPVVKAGDAEPVAMFHDIKKSVTLR